MPFAARVKIIPVVSTRLPYTVPLAYWSLNRYRVGMASREEKKNIDASLLASCWPVVSMRLTNLVFREQPLHRDIASHEASNTDIS
jgi:hypothetical protein